MRSLLILHRHLHHPRRNKGLIVHLRALTQAILLWMAERVLMIRLIKAFYLQFYFKKINVILIKYDPFLHFFMSILIILFLY